MRRLSTFVYPILSILVLFCSCNGGQNYLSYREKPFSAGVKASLCGTDYTCRITYRSADDFSVDFFEPNGLAGMHAQKIGDKITISLGEMTCEGDFFADLLDIANAFVLNGFDGSDIKRVKKCSGGREILFADENGTCTLLINDRNIPVSVRTESCTVTVEWMDFEQSDT